MAQQLLNDKVELAGITPDRKTEDANQIIFLANRGVYFNFFHHEGTIFNPIKVWYPELFKKHHLLEDKKQVALVKKATVRPARTTQGRSLIDEFNATYTVEELLIQAGYAQKGTNFRHPNSQTGNYSASIKNGKLFTLSSSDPLYSTYAHDAFNVFIILLNEGDRKAVMRNAGDNWLNVEGLSWNKYQQQAYKEAIR